MSNFKEKDPYYQREAERYDNPIPSREYILQYLEERGRPTRYEHLVKAFSLGSPEQQTALERRLGAMVKQGQLMANRRGSYALVDKMDLVRGQVIGHRDGHGYVITDDEEGDIYLSPYQMRAVFPGDIVLVRVDNVDNRGQRQGIVVEIVQHNTTQLVGRFGQEDGINFVEPENKKINQDILVPPGQEHDAKPGQIVTVEITAQPTHKKQAIGKVIEIVGEQMAPGLEIDVAVRAHDIPYIWSEEVEQELKQIPQDIDPAEITVRKDLRQLMFITIDGEDAKDFDDAVYCEPTAKGGWKLWVAIADVSHYVNCQTALDEEAEVRGNSVYFSGRVVPMLPELLSNGLCSLNPEVERYSVVCQMNITKEGVVSSYRFFDAVIRSQYRLTYNEALQLFKQQAKKPLQSLQKMLMHMHQLYKILHRKRKERGALDFETTETKIIFDDNGKIDKIVPTQRNDAHRMIEEFMLAANVSCAKYLSKHNMPMLYRVHEGIDNKKIKDLTDYLKGLGIKIGFNEKKRPTSKDIAKLLRRAQARADGHIIQTVILRAMRPAVYTPANKGHFGLAYKEYGHFTSPIRRYPDLTVHRAIKHLNRGGEKENFIYSYEDMKYLGEHCSMTERRADEATRDVVAWLKCEYIQDKIGQEFIGHVSGVTSFGIFVELKDIYVDGLVHVTNLANDYYQYDPTRYRLVGRRSGKIYKLGDEVNVRVAKVNLDERLIDFELA